MRAARALLGCVLLLTWGSPYAQNEQGTKEAKKKSPPRETAVEKKPAKKDPQPPKPQKPRAQQQQNDPWTPQNQRATERTAANPPPDQRGHTVSKDSQPPRGPPSKAQQMQQEQYEQRRAQSGQPPSDSAQVVQCRARPVCRGGYGICQAVTQTFTGASVPSSRQAIVQQCMQANTPDTCECTSQCERVAQCSIF